jgi:diguanylate cyclase (GGDEF)-like protein/PAS domain S-box-containing protein
MAAKLRVLIVEDTEDDLSLLLRELRRGFDPEWQNVQTADAMRLALRSGTWHVVISDYQLPLFNGFEALRTLQEAGLDIPFILVSGTIGEETAVEAMKAGAHDYLMKGKLHRLVPAVERELREAELRAAHRKNQKTLLALEKAVESLPIGVTIAGTDGKIIYTNPAEARLHGYSPDELVGKAARILVSSEFWKTLGPQQLKDLRSWKRERVNVRKDGTTFPAQLISDVVKDGGGQPIGIVTLCEDISDRKFFEEQLERHAFHDDLTGLANRALFSDRLGRSLARAKRKKEYEFAVLFLDVDRFKLVNDSLGHSVGDALLVAMARRLERCLRPGDTIARLGGDEFTILLEDVTGKEEVVRIAERMQAELAIPFELEGQEVFATASIGIAMSSPSYQRQEDVLRDADAAMYRAKARGKARFEVFNVSMHTNALSMLQLETDLRHALERGEIHPYFQPIVDLRSGKITGFEALARWRHPQRGLVLPDAFIPLAEETGLIVALGASILRDACSMMRHLQSTLSGAPTLQLSVNVSTRQLTQSDLLHETDRILSETGFEAGALNLEITETGMIANADAAEAIMRELRTRRIKVHVDDFGTGYSSLSYLQRFPVDTLKIDRSFVARIGKSGEKTQIIESIVNMARSLELEVMAEGIEDAHQLTRLREMKCDSGQGWYFSRPVPAEKLHELVTAPVSW